MTNNGDCLPTSSPKTRALSSLASVSPQRSITPAPQSTPGNTSEDDASYSDGDSEEPDPLNNNTGGKVGQIEGNGHPRVQGDVDHVPLSIDLDDSLNHLDQSVLYGRQSPPTTKPSLISPNALRLQIDEPPIPDPSFSHSSPPSSPDERSKSPMRPSPRVRFRSRVRITSGLHRHRSVSGVTDPTSASSSASGSPSSSISAPLRSQADDESNPWGPLGRRVSYFAWQKRLLANPQSNLRRVGSHETSVPVVQGAGERTPLNAPVRQYGEGERAREDSFDSSEEDQRLDLVFGTWPRRLLNHRWWWWQLEPVVYCHCVDDSDTED